MFANATNAYKAAQGTREVLSGHSVEKLGIRATRDVKMAELAIPATEVPVAAAAAALP